jgi:glycosyltransferase involved in cell wall biosynthesis
VHETSIKPASFKSFLRSIVQKCASKVIYVSKSLENMESFSGIPSELIYNALSKDLMSSAALHDYQWRRNGFFDVLMICSLKPYKGVNEFVAIAALCQKEESLKFSLLLNADKSEIDAYFKDIDLPENLILVSSQNDVIPFYKNASLLLNLSRVDQWVETFGLTIIEALAFGVPVIVPPVGGPPEIIRDGKEGYLVSSYDAGLIADLITDLATDEKKCMRFSARAKERSSTFSEDVFDTRIVDSFAKFMS